MAAPPAEKPLRGKGAGAALARPRPWWRLWCCRRRRAHGGGALLEEEEEAAEAAEQQEREAQERERQAAALSAFEVELGKATLVEVEDVLVPGETRQSCLLRFLRARDYRVDAAAEMLRKDMVWRKALNMRALASKRRAEVAGCDEEVLREHLPCWHQGYDRAGRPVIIKQYGKTRLPALFPHVSVDGLELLHAYENERTAVLCGQQSTKLGKDITKAVYIIDAEGWDPSNLRSTAALSYAQKMAKVDQDHYPERLGVVFIVNSPLIVSIFWGLVRPFLDPKTRDKVRIFSDRQQWIPALTEVIDPAHLPAEYGGSAAPAIPCR